MQIQKSYVMNLILEEPTRQTATRWIYKILIIYDIGPKFSGSVDTTRTVKTPKNIECVNDLL